MNFKEDELMSYWDRWYGRELSGDELEEIRLNVLTAIEILSSSSTLEISR